MKIKERHDWVWRIPEHGKRTCQKCGLVIDIWKHDRLGPCPGKHPKKQGMLSEEQIWKVACKIYPWKQVTPITAFDQLFLETAKALLQAQLDALASVKDKELVLNESELREPDKTITEALGCSVYPYTMRYIFRLAKQLGLLDSQLAKAKLIFAAREALKEKEWLEAIEDARLAGYESGRHEKAEAVKAVEEQWKAQMEVHSQQES